MVDSSAGMKRLYGIYYKMLHRCYEPKCKAYPAYGGSGIEVCDEWIESRESFVKWSLENGYAVGLMIDRVDNERGYSPDNCRWVTMWEQQYNRRLKRRWPVGVRKVGRRFQASLCVNRKRTSLGMFSTPEAAHEAYRQAVKEVHGLEI